MSCHEDMKTFPLMRDDIWTSKILDCGLWSGCWILDFIFHHWIMIFENAEWVGCGCGVTSQDEREGPF